MKLALQKHFMLAYFTYVHKNGYKSTYIVQLILISLCQNKAIAREFLC